MKGAFNGWHGVYSFGPRYLAPAVPFIALPLAPVFERLPRLAGAVALLSGGMILFATAVDPQVPFDVPHPWADYLVPLATRSEEHTSELQSLAYLVCRLLLEKKKTHQTKC